MSSALVRLLRFILASIAATIFGGGCSQLPQHELSQYRAAFAEVEAASTEILVDYAEAVEEAQSLRASAAAPAIGAHQFATELSNVDGAQLPDVEVRRLAFRTIARFNDALAMFAEGKSVEAVQSSTSAFVEALGKFIEAGGSSLPGLSAATGTVQTIAALAEQARVRKEFEIALRKGAPLVRQILTALIAERGDHLELRRAEANLAQVDIIAEIQGGLVSIIALFESRDEPEVVKAAREAAARAEADPDDADLARVAAQAAEAAERLSHLPDMQARINEALEPARLFEPIELTYQFGGPDFGEADQIVAAQAVAQIESSVAAYLANIEQYERLRQALSDYGLMLATTRAALDSLVAALDQPPNLDQATEDMFNFAFSIKRNIEALRAARSAAH